MSRKNFIDDILDTFFGETPYYYPQRWETRWSPRLPSPNFNFTVTKQTTEKGDGHDGCDHEHGICREHLFHTTSSEATICLLFPNAKKEDISVSYSGSDVLVKVKTSQEVKKDDEEKTDVAKSETVDARKINVGFEIQELKAKFDGKVLTITAVAVEQDEDDEDFKQVDVE